MDISKNHLDELTTKLISRGEDKFELELWLRIFESLSDEEKTDLISNLEQELKSLEAIKNK